MLDFAFIRDNWFFIASGIGTTLGITVVSFLLAAPLGAIVATGRRSTFLPIKAIFSIYVLFIDGIPLLLQIFFIFLALPQLGIVLPGLGAAFLVLTVNYSSRMSEVFSSRITGEGKTQDENLFSWISPLASEFNHMIKDSTLLSVTGFIHDIMWRATRVGRAEFKNLEAFIVAGIIYLVLITCITLGVKVLKFMTAAPKSTTEGA